MVSRKSLSSPTGLFSLPDTNPMQINGKRLQQATCIHKRCLMTQTRKLLWRPWLLRQPGAFIMGTFLSLARTCTAEPIQNKRLFNGSARSFRNKPALRFSGVPICPETTRDLRVAFGERVDVATRRRAVCPRLPLRVWGRRFRCRPLKPIAAPEIPGIHFQPAVEPQPAGASCALSRDCQTGLICDDTPYVRIMRQGLRIEI